MGTLRSWVGSAVSAGLIVAVLTGCVPLKVDPLSGNPYPAEVIQDFPQFASSLDGVEAAALYRHWSGTLEGGTYVKFTVELDGDRWQQVVDATADSITSWVTKQEYGPRMHIEVTLRFDGNAIDLAQAADRNRERTAMAVTLSQVPEISHFWLQARWSSDYRSTRDDDNSSLRLVASSATGVVPSAVLKQMVAQLAPIAPEGGTAVVSGDVLTVGDHAVAGGLHRVVQVSIRPFSAEQLECIDLIDANPDVVSYDISTNGSIGSTKITLRSADGESDIRAYPGFDQLQDVTFSYLPSSIPHRG